ncbi:hypothetical protein B566_EDAN006647 [Ephemera danica]|nr:hypothetical protein B566_EDAN006647 [Ephemera danica]
MHLLAGSQEMSRYHSQLVDLCKESQVTEKSLLALESSLERESQRCETLRVRMESVKERLGIVETIKNLKLKRPWIAYENHLKLIEEVKNDQKLAADNLKEKKKAFAPLEKEIQTIKQRLTSLANSMKAKTVPGQSMINALELQDQMMQKMVENQRRLKNQEVAEEARQQQLEVNEQKVGQIEAEINAAVKAFSEKDNKAAMLKNTEDLQIVDCKLQEALLKHRTCSALVKEFERELEDIKAERDELHSNENRKWESLKRNDKDAFRASKWVAENRDSFRGMILQSLMLEIQMKNPNDGRYLEMLIPRQDKKALVCERAEEMKVLVQRLKSELQVRVNVLQSPNEEPRIQRSTPDELRECGFNALVVDLFTGPLPIRNYLCRSRGVHLVPVAATERQVNIELAKKKFNRFFAGECLFSIKKSKYSGLISMRTVPLTQSNSFHAEVDSNAMKGIKEREDAAIAGKTKAQKEVAEIQQEIQKWRTEKDKIDKKRTELKKQATHQSILNAEKAKYEARIRALMCQKDNLDKERTKCHAENKKMVTEAVNQLAQLTKMLKESHDLDIQLELLSVEERTLRNSLVVKEHSLRDVRSGLKDLEKQNEELKKLLEDRKRQGQRFLSIAKEATGSSPGEPAFAKIQAIFNELPATTDEIDIAIKDNEGRLEFCGSDTNMNVPNDYENYGLQIKVKFRAEEPMRDLSSTQSGGERSVSTAIYLLALQELTNVPFRCMDEINQGMDPTNERRIMNLMMKMSELEDTCQYFVVTPKLLLTLDYASSVTVMCVCQPKRFDTTQWTMRSFLDTMRQNSQNTASTSKSRPSGAKRGRNND